MKISYNWLKEFVDHDLSPRDLQEKLTMVGLAVDAVEAVGDDHVLELDLTSNRPDCLSHLGVAREVAAVAERALRVPIATAKASKTTTSDLTSVEIMNPGFCPRYSARLIKGVKIGPSPDWLVRRLEAMGQRSVNNVADITNYVMLELGQPLHAFDFHQLKGRRIIVRAARAGEKMTTLDGEERELTPQMLVIADAERAVALAGIKGGEDSGVTEATTDVLLEAAYFTPAQVRATSKALGLSTEASYRFERGTDPEVVTRASERAAAMIAVIAGGEVLRDLVDVYPGRDAIQSQRSQIIFRCSRYEALTGLKVKPGDAKQILRRLGLNVETGVKRDALIATAPSWRIDLQIEEDLIEEIARFAGYDKLKISLPGSAGAGAYLENEDGRRAIRLTLAGLGYHEAVSFSFVNAETDALLSDAEENARLTLLNPIDETQSHLRTTLLGGLLKALERNLNHGTRNVRLFEIGKCFLGNGEERPDEIERLALVATGARNEDDWQAASARVDFYDLKGVIESIGEQLGLLGLTFTPRSDRGYLHPGRAALISLRNQQGGDFQIGQIGQLHPRVAANYKFKQPVFVAEMNLSQIFIADRVEVRYRPLPRYPTATRDLAVLVETARPFAAIEAAVRSLEIPELIGVRLFDLFAGKEMPPGKHSLALSLRYRSDDRTLTDEEVNAAHDRVVQKLVEEFEVEIR